VDRTKVIAIGGGPSGGKTTFLDYALPKLTALGIRPFLVPECASMLIGGGIPDISEIEVRDPKTYVEIERQMLLLHLDLKKRFTATADIFKNEKRVLLCDRGAKEVDAYLSSRIFEALLQDERLNLWDVSDCYDAVIFLRSAASGAEKFYTTANNPSRQEKDPKKARRVDELTLKVWIGHQHLWIIPSREDFQEKLDHALRAILHAVQTPSVEIERWFLLKEKPNFRAKAFRDAVRMEIEQIYLLGGGRIRKITEGDYSSYYFAKKEKVPGSKIARHERERRISALDYFWLGKERDPARKVVKKDRWYFVWNNQYFALDVFREPKKLFKLEIELLDEDDTFELPLFLKIDREVTGDPSCSTSEIAKCRA